MNLKELKSAFGLKAIYGLDFETFYDPKDKYSLRGMATTEYIVDKRFEAQMLSVQKDTWKKPRVFTGQHAIAKFFRSVDWSTSGMLAHHTHFDGLIASHHFGVLPKMYLDTLSMARPLMPVQVGGSLKAITEAFGRPGKKRAAALADVAGKRLDDFTPSQLRELALYAGDDIDDTWFIFDKMLPFTSEREMALIDITVKMYARPTIQICQKSVKQVYDDEVDAKEDLLKELKLERIDFTSNNRFVELLRDAGVEPPTKISPTTGEETFALAKGDLEFMALRKHKSKRVRELVEARLAVKTSIVETRSERFESRATILEHQPVYLNYFGAKTGRWSGGDKINYQNLGRRSPLRTAIQAPKGCRFIIADQAQIEARGNAYISGQQNIIDAFARGDDVYKLAASNTYNKPVGQITGDERFVGKVQVLALGYQAGAGRFAEMLRLGQFGPPMDVTDQHAADLVKAWRQNNPYIVANWRRMQNAMRSAFAGRQRIQCGMFWFEGFEGRGVMELPGGTYIRYDALQIDEMGGITYAAKWRRKQDGEVTEQRTHLYGGIIVENATQGMSRNIIGENLVDISRLGGDLRIVMSTHDEIVCVVPKAKVARYTKQIEKIMTTPPEWAPNLPLAVEIHDSERYDK